MRAMIRALAAVVSIGALVSACVDNEVSFYVEHMKAQPEAPSCTVSAGDDFASSGTLDLAIAGDYEGWFYVTNAVMERESYESLRAETDGIFVEGAEVNVTAGDGGGMVGGSEYYLFNIFIPPETSAIVPAIAIPPAVVDELVSAYGCRRIASYTGSDVYDAMTSEEEEAQWPPAAIGYGFVYANVRFLGHTQGGIDVMTQEFSIAISVCCNCLINWENCLDPCGAFCAEGTGDSVCSPGVATSSSQKIACEDLYFGRLTQWEEADGGLFDCEECGGTNN